jgi:dipeptidyl aminopeptidase/acylaminoacyl peptidase
VAVGLLAEPEGSLELVDVYEPARTRTLRRARDTLYGWPDWSPDGKRLVWYEFNQAGEEYLTVMDMDTRAVHRLQTTRAPSSPQWNPTGRWIAFVGRDETRSGVPGAAPDVHLEINVIAPDGTRESRVPASERLRHWVWVSPQELLCVGRGADRSRPTIVEVNVFTDARKDVCEEVALPGPLVGEDIRPRWDSQRQRLVLTVELPTAQSEETSLAGAIVRFDLADRSVRQLTGGPADSRPAWTGDGQHIVFVREGASLWIMNADGSGQREVIGVDDLREGS